VAEDEADLTVAQMSDATGVSAHTLRYYERAGLIRRVARNSGNQRRYSAADVEWVGFLLRLRETGMPIAKMREYATLRERGPVTTEPRLRLLEAHQAGLGEQIARLHAHEKALAEDGLRADVDNLPRPKIAIYRDDLAALRAHRQDG
jgi:DNA-binding transcriptional MerR regulator